MTTIDSAEVGSRSQTELLEAILERLERLEHRLDVVATVSEELPGLGAMVTDIVDERMQVAQGAGFDVDASLEAATELLIKLAEPRTLKVLTAMVDHLPKLEPVLAQLDELPGLMAMVMDSFDELVARAQANGLRVEDLLKNGVLAASKLVGFLESREMAALLESGVLSPEAVAVVARASTALTAAGQAPAGKTGLWGLMRASRQPEFQRATHFLVQFAAAFGQGLDPSALGAPDDVPRLANKS